jgi:hypothetical protein
LGYKYKPISIESEPEPPETMETEVLLVGDLRNLSFFFKLKSKIMKGEETVTGG